jgi:hypothetical protein
VRLFEKLFGERDDAPSISLVGELIPLPRHAAAQPADDDHTRQSRLIDDMARHVMAKVAPIVDMHGRTMETADQANVMAVEVAVRLGLEAAQRCALTAVSRGKPEADALAVLDDMLALIGDGLADHRNDLARLIQAAHAGRNKGFVR